MASALGIEPATDVNFGLRFMTTALDGLGSLDIIVNNAGYAWDGVIHKMTDEQFEAMLDIHLKAPFRIPRAASDFIRDGQAGTFCWGARASKRPA